MPAGPVRAPGRVRPRRLGHEQAGHRHRRDGRRRRVAPGDPARPATPQAPTSQKPAQKPAAQKAAPAAKPVAPAELDRLLAPVALYPDPLLGQILLCSQNPVEGGCAGRMAGRPVAQGQRAAGCRGEVGLRAELRGARRVPGRRQRHGEPLDRTTRVGQAFTADRSAVFASIQRLRTKAKDVGTLKTTPQQEVSTKATSTGEVIVIEPANPQVVYVPQYNPEVVYTQPASTTVVIQEEDDDDYAEAVAAGMIGFTAGVAIGAAVNNNYYYGGYGYRGGFYMHNDGWDDYYDHREDARDDWQDHREDIYEDRGDVARETQEQRTERAQNAQEQRTERTQTRQENPQTQAQRDQRRTDAQAKAGEARSTGATSQEARGFSGDGGADARTERRPQRDEVRRVLRLLEREVGAGGELPRRAEPEQLGRIARRRRRIARRAAEGADADDEPESASHRPGVPVRGAGAGAVVHVQHAEAAHVLDARRRRAEARGGREGQEPRGGAGHLRTRRQGPRRRVRSDRRAPQAPGVQGGRWPKAGASRTAGPIAGRWSSATRPGRSRCRW